jgi:integrating conjugative element protein (TIGR03756 family)
MGQAKYLCNSEIKSYMPYYLSTLDEKMWRSGLSDMLYPSTWVPGMNEVSSNKNQTDEFLKSWGSLYPRSGFLNQKNEVKTASVIAARALEVVSDGGARIYQSSGCTSADCMKKNGKWQMISPVEENSCRAFGIESVEELKE